jgi:hypothetical protein
MEKHHFGDVRDSDGKVFLSYRKNKLKDGSVAVYENWVTKEKFEEIRVRRIKQQAQYRKLSKHKARMQRYRKEYRKTAHGSKWIKDYRKNYYEKNCEKLIKKQREYCKDPETRKLINKRRREKTATNPQFAIGLRVRNRIRKALKLVGAVKSKSTRELLGCSFEFLKQHIEGQFRDGMSWDKPHSFHIDHIRPLSSFDLTDPEQLKAACHWTNLQPLPPLENIRKSNKFYPDTHKEAA